MTQEQARQEAERRVEEFFNNEKTDLFYRESVQCELISINRELDLLNRVKLWGSNIDTEIVDGVIEYLNQIKDELLKM